MCECEGLVGTGSKLKLQRGISKIGVAALSLFSRLTQYNVVAE